MKVILMSQRQHRVISTLDLGARARVALVGGLLLLPLMLGAAGFFGARLLSNDLLGQDVMAAWDDALKAQQSELDETRTRSRQEIEALTVRMAELQARLIRLDALGERITTVAKLDKSEFNFGQTPAVGGPEGDAPADAEAYGAPEFLTVIDDLGEQIEDRAQQLDILAGLLANRKMQKDVYIAGRPIHKGWMSSGFGRRTDPFKGHVAWHKGVDFAGKQGSAVVAVAAGVVTWSGDRYGYGTMVEVNHGDGYVTRYAHNEENLVGVGEVVKKGEDIARMGSSGRSTGPHVHFEILRHGKAIDPTKYTWRSRD